MTTGWDSVQIVRRVKGPYKDWCAQVEAHTRSDLLAALAGHAVFTCHSAHVFSSVWLVSPKGGGVLSIDFSC